MIKFGIARKLTAVLANLSLLLNSFLPLVLAIQPVYAQSSETIVSTIQYNSSVHKLNVTTNTLDKIAYQLFYKTPEKIDAIAGNDLSQANFYLGTCSADDCLPQNISRGVLKIESNSKFYSKFFTLENNVLTVVKEIESSQSDLTEEENNFLENNVLGETDSNWTFKNVELNKEYTASGVTLTFTKLPQNSGNIKIQEITLTSEQIKQTGSLSDKAYDITSDMADGSFAYNLSLPIPESSNGKSVDVKFAEDISQIDLAQTVDNTINSTATSVSVKNLDHFTIFVVTLDPSWTSPTGGGVYSAYIGPPTYGYISPGTTVLYDGREAGIIKAGLNIDSDGHYWDEGLFGFKPNISINDFADGTVTYDVENQEGTNPVWMTIEIDTGGTNDRSDNVTYQFVPTTNPTGWHTVNANTGLWQKWNDNNGDVTGNPLISLTQIALDNFGLNVVRAYLRLGMGDSYHGTGSGTIAWVDKATLGGQIYDFVLPAYTTTQAATSVSSTDATLNGTAGNIAASGHSFWVSLSPFVTASPSIPIGVYSTPVLSSLNIYDNFSSTLSSITTSGVHNNLPSITPNTTYYFAAWTEVNGTWYPGEVNSFTTLTPPDTTAPSVPTNGTPNNTSIATNNFDFNWDDSTDDSLITYKYQASQNPTNSGGVLTNGLWTSGTLPTSMIHSSGAGDGTWYWQVKAVDTTGNESAWSPIWNVTLDTIAPTATINYSITTLTNGDVTATLVPNEAVTVTNNGGSTSYIFTDNGSFTFQFKDAAGNTGSTTATVTNIDKTAPTTPGQIGWSTENPPVGSDYTNGTDFNNYRTCGQNLNYSPMTNLWGPSTDANGVVGYDREVYSPEGTLIYSSSLSTNYVNGGGAVNGSTYWTRVRAYDAAGNKSDWTPKCGITYDVITPTVISVDSDGQVFTNSTSSPRKIKITFSEDISNTPIIEVHTVSSDQLVNNCSDSDNKTFCFDYAVPANQEMNHTIYISGAKDLAGNTMILDNVHTFYVDTINPSATVSYDITTPTNHDVVATINPSESITVTNNGGSINHTFTSNGSFTFEFVDTYGNTGTVVATVSNIDKTAPVLDSQTTFSGWYTANQTSVFNYTDSLSGIASGNPVSCVIKTQGTNRTCSVTPNVCDNVGNCNTTTVTSNGADIDKTNPTGAWTYPVEGQHVSGSIDLSVSANDTISGLDFVRLRYGVDTSHLKTLVDDSTAPYGTTWDTTGLSNGNYVLRARVQDNSGRSNIQDINVVVDNTAPTITSVSSDGATYNLASANPAIKITFDEDISNPPTVEMFSPVGDLQTVNDCSDSDAKTFCFMYSLNNEETTHTIHIYGAQDAAGNTMSLNTTHTFIVDRIAPIFISSTPFEGWYNTNQTSTFNYSGSISGNDFTCDITTEGSNQTCTVATPNVCDAAGNCNTTPVTSNPANLDFTNPVSTIEGGDNEETIYSNSWDGSLSGTATDDLSGVFGVKISIKNESGQYYNGTSFVPSGSELLLDTTYNGGSWTYTGLIDPPEDTYTIKSHAIDNAGNMENTYTLTIVLDKTISEVSISLNPTDPDASNGWYKTQPEVTLTQTDTNFDKIEYQWNSETGAWITYTGPFKPITQGAQILYYRAVDKATNVSAVGVKNIKWDNTELEYGPQNISANPNPTSGSTSKIKWEAAKDNDGIDKYEIQWTLNNSTENKSYSKTVSNTTFETEIDQLIEGRWTVKVIAFDASGKSRDNSIDLVVDRTAPSAPTLNLTGTGTGTASLSWNAVSDAVDYIIWYGISPGQYLYGARVGNVTSYTVQKLGSGNYYFAIKSVDSAQNQSAFSNEVNTGNIIGAPGTTPNQPAEGFTSEVLGANTNNQSEGANQNESGEVLGTTEPSPGHWLPLLFIIALVVNIFYLKRSVKLFNLIPFLISVLALILDWILIKKFGSLSPLLRQYFWIGNILSWIIPVGLRSKISQH